MKTMTCKQLGGVCDKKFKANSFEEIAEKSNCSTTLAADLGVYFNTANASAAFLPLTISTINLALRGANLTCRRIALASAIFALPCSNTFDLLEPIFFTLTQRPFHSLHDHAL